MEENNHSVETRGSMPDTYTALISLSNATMALWDTEQDITKLYAYRKAVCKEELIALMQEFATRLSKISDILDQLDPKEMIELLPGEKGS